MNIPWPGNRCILCLKESPLSKEHIIPEAFGGILTCSLLCRDCNSNLGSSVEAEAKTDPSIRIAVANLQSHIPELADRFMENQNFVSHGPGGTEQGTVRDGEYRVRSQKKEDGSLIQPTDCARKSIITILQRGGAGQAAIRESLRKFDEGGENERIRLAIGVEAIRWAVEKIDPDLSSSSPLTPLVPLKIAYEFIACHLGTAIYDETLQIQEIRTTLLEGIKEHPSFEVERLEAPEYKPFHGICFEGNDPHGKVLIRLFGRLAFRVHFRWLAFGGSRFVYTHCLATHEDSLDELSD